MAHSNLGIAYSQQGKLDKAIAAWKKAIAINPDDANSDLSLAHSSLGYAYRKQGKYDLAIVSFKKAIGIDPNFASPHYSLACVYSLQDEKKLSLEFLQKAIGLDEKWIQKAKADSDFDNIRESPEWKQLINSIE